MGSICDKDEDTKSAKEKNAKQQQSLRNSYHISRKSPNPNQLYQEAVWYFNQERYQEALQKFEELHKLAPKNLSILRMKLTAAILIKASTIYFEGIYQYQLGYQLYSAGQYQNALKRFQYVEKELYENYKNCRLLIYDCRAKIWQKIMAPSIQRNKEIQEKKRTEAEKQKLLATFYELLNEEIEKRVKLRMQKQIKDEEDGSEGEEEKNCEMKYKNIRKQSIANFKTGKDIPPNFNDKELEKVEIYYVCNKKPQCKINNKSQPFKHEKCGKIAYLNTNGEISCQSGCKAYYIGEALFSCQKRQVIERSDESKIKDLEVIRDSMLYAQFLEDCMEKDDHSDILKDNFRLSASAGMLSLLNYNE